MKFEKFAEDGNRFLQEVAAELGTLRDENQAYRIMRSVLHTIREVLSPEESLHMISQLPLSMKGVYVDGWHLPVKDRIRSMNEFLVRLRSQNERVAPVDFADDETAKHHTKCVLNVLKRHVSTGEIQDVIDQFPVELMELWITEEKDKIGK